MSLETHTTYNSYLQKRFGAKTYKVSISSGLTCPTRDGLIDKGGCAFCDARGSSSFYGKKDRGEDVRFQIQSKIPGIQKRFHGQKFLAYFQSYTNTYGEVDYLREIYTAALSEPQISGLCVGTRPDCLPDDVIELLEELAETHYVSLELGVQSFEDPTLLWLLRGHDAQSSIDALKKLRARAPHVQTCAHLIFGNPTDSVDCARNAALILNELQVDGAKLHNLMVLRNTKLARLYEEQPFKVLELEEYAKIVVEFLEHLDPKIYVERLSSTSTHPDECVAPAWSRDRWAPINFFREYLGQRGVRQGSKL